MSLVQTFQIESTYVALNDENEAWPLPVTPDFWSALQSGRLGEFSRMISYYAFDTDWSSWEKHPAGEEFVCLLEGDVDFILDRDGAFTSVRLNQPGSFVLVPADTWHTAKVRRPSKMLFVTPGEGTENRSIDPEDETESQ